MPLTVTFAILVGATAYQISASPSRRLENVARCQVKPPPVTEVKRWPPEVGPSVASRATTRVLGWVVENDFDEIRFDGEFCCVTDLVTLVIAARLLGPAGCMARMAVARPPAIAAYQRPRRGRGKRTAFVDVGFPTRDPAAPPPKNWPAISSPFIRMNSASGTEMRAPKSAANDAGRAQMSMAETRTRVGSLPTGVNGSCGPFSYSNGGRFL